MNDGRDMVPWGPDIWARIDEAVQHECKRTKVAAKFLPLYGPVDPAALTVPSDTVVPRQGVLDVYEAAVTEVLEIQVFFKLTLQQVLHEQHLMTAVTLATRAANLLSQGEDLLIFRGQKAAETHSLFQDKKDPGGRVIEPRKVHLKSGKAGSGLLNLPEQKENGANKDRQVITVEGGKDKDGIERWREITFQQVQKAYANLQSGEGLSQAHYGPYALVLHHVPFADTFAPLVNTLILTADRIKPLVTSPLDGKCHFYGTGTLRPEPYTGIFASIGGNTLDLVMARGPTTAYLQKDVGGDYLFRVFEIFAVREKDASSVVRLEFQVA